MSNAKVELFDVAIKGCGDAALRIPNTTSETTTLVATRCEFANSHFGAVVIGSLTSATFNNIPPTGHDMLSTALQNDLQIVTAAVKQNGRSLEYVHPALKANADVCRAAVTQNGLSLSYFNCSQIKPCTVLYGLGQAYLKVIQMLLLHFYQMLLLLNLVSFLMILTKLLLQIRLQVFVCIKLLLRLKKEKKSNMPDMQ